MNKAQLCEHMARHFAALSRAGRGPELRRRDAREFLEELERLCVQELARCGQFSLTGVGKLVVRTRGPRQGRNPKTGEKMVIPERRVVRARISSKVRNAIEGPV